jgi:hypothetical protein
VEWLDKELGSVWKDDKDYKYNLMLEIKTYWITNLAKKLWTVYVNKLFHKSYAEYILHDGNRCCGRISSYIGDYEEGGDLLVKEGWNTLQDMLKYVREAEVFILLCEREEII